MLLVRWKERAKEMAVLIGIGLLMASMLTPILIGGQLAAHR